MHRSTWVSPSPFTSEQLGRALLLVLTKLLDRIVTRRRAWMIECVRRQSGSRLPSMVLLHYRCITAAFAKLHLAHLNFIAGQEDAALARLKEHLSWRVQRGRDTCAGCGQTRGEDTPMLTCSGCRVARFCSADHQKTASKKAGLSLWTGRHKDICGVLRKWREAVKDGVVPDSCTAELVAFLQRENARCTKDAEGAPETVLS
jgi:hypothetical protein